MMRLLIIALLTSIPLCTSESLCEALHPFHDISPMITASPFNILTSVSTARQSEILTIQIKSILSEFYFGGFTIHARSTSPPYQVLGRFVPSRTELKLSNCNGDNNTATYHAYPGTESEVELQWQAPNDFVGEIFFKATIAKELDRFWVGITSTPVKIVPSVNVEDFTNTVFSSLISPNPLKIEHQLGPNNDEQVNSNHIYDGCGSTKTCTGLPNNCVEQQSCETIATATVVNNRYQFELQSIAVDVSYIALGLSKDDVMGDDSVVECLQEGGDIQLFSSWNTGRPGTGNTRQGVPQNIIQLLDASFVSGTLYCKYERDAFSTVNGIDFDLVNRNFSLVSGTRVAGTPIVYNNSIASNQPMQIIENQNVDSIYEGCGTAKTCFGFPANCVAQQSCQAVATAVYVDGQFEFELQSNASNLAYVSLALSRDHLMGDDSVMNCIVQNNNVSLYSSWLYRRSSSRINVTQDIIEMVNSSFTNGQMYCKLTRVPITKVRGTEFNLLTEHFYFLMASGTNLNDASVAQHNILFTASDGPLAIVGTPPPNDPIYDGCETETTCFGIPVNCVEEESCDVIVSASIVNEKYIFELRSSVRGAVYVAFGLSRDQYMGGDSVIECVVQGGIVSAHSSWNTIDPRYDNTRQNLPENIISLLIGSYVNETIYCKVERDAVTTKRGKEFNLDNQNFHFLLAVGSNLRDSHSIGMHSLAGASSEPMRFPGREAGNAQAVKISILSIAVWFFVTNISQFLR